MAGKNTDRKSANKSLKSAQDQDAYSMSTFVFPDSLSCSEVQFPVLISTKKIRKANWNDIVSENEKRMQEIEKFWQRKNGPTQTFYFPGMYNT